MSANPAQLFLLADHIKLSLLERQRAVSLNLEPNSHDGQISRSLDQLKSGIDALESQNDINLHDQLTRLQSQYASLSSEFDPNSATPASSKSPDVTSPNDPLLASDFAAATRKPAHSTLKRSGRTSSPISKSVRFTDDPTLPTDDAARSALFNQPYRDEPDGPPDQSELNNQQIHTYHSRVLAEQDAQLDELGQSIGRQRELSMAIGDELDGQVLLLDDVEEGVDRHVGQLDRAKGSLGRFSRKARENWSMGLIVLLIVILVLLIIILK